MFLFLVGAVGTVFIGKLASSKPVLKAGGTEEILEPKKPPKPPKPGTSKLQNGNYHIETNTRFTYSYCTVLNHLHPPTKALDGPKTFKGCRKSVHEVGSRPVIVALYGEGLCSAVDVYRLTMIVVFISSAENSNLNSPEVLGLNI